MSTVTRTAGVVGTFPVTFTQAPVQPPTLTVYSDPARSVVAVPTAPLAATASVTSWVATYPATLPTGTYYLTVAAVYTTGQPPVLDQDDTLVLTTAESSVTEGLVSLDRVKTHLGLENTTRHDAELVDLIESCTPVIEELAGPVFPRTVTEPLRGNVLRFAPVMSVLSVSNGGVTVDPASYVLDGPAGLFDLTVWSRDVTVTYVAGRATVPANIRRAALRWISWSWRRDHGGSESYMPAGDDAVPGLGVVGIEKELRHILGPDLRGMRVA